MAKISRFFKIIHTVGRYRLDVLFKTHTIPLRYRILLAPFKLYPTGKQSDAQRLRFALESLGPIFIKFGQLLSTRPDLIPYEIITELAQLQDNVAPFDSAVFRHIVEDSLGSPVETLFEHYDHEPLASASVAQVHAAVLTSGEEVIVKAIRPGIDKTIAQDVQLMQLIARIVEAISPDGKRLRPIAVVEDYKETIFDELALSLEAANASQLRRNFEDSDLLYIPKIYWDYTKKNVLVMERIYGIPVNNIAEIKAQNTNMHMLAERGVEIFFRQVFEHNFFHADMHPGNVFVSFNTPDTPSYIAVDMAVIGSLTREDQYYLARNLLAMFRRDYRQVAELHVSSGWVPEGTSVSGFEAAIRAVCEPIFEKPLKEISFGEALITIFRTAQRYNMPVQPQLVLLQKTLLNIEGLGRQLYPELNLWDTAHPFLERWIKQRYHPKTMWQEFQYNAPEWLEKLPQLPQMVFSSYQDIKHIAEMAPKLIETQEQLVKTRKRGRKILKSIAIITIIAGLSLSWPNINTLKTETLLLWALAVLALIR